MGESGVNLGSHLSYNGARFPVCVERLGAVHERPSIQELVYRHPELGFTWFVQGMGRSYVAITGSRGGAGTAIGNTCQYEGVVAMQADR